MARKTNLKLIGKILVVCFILVMVVLALEVAWDLNRRAMKVNQALVISNRPWLDEKTILRAYELIQKKSK